jgi:predicted transposase YdaD
MLRGMTQEVEYLHSMYQALRKREKEGRGEGRKESRKEGRKDGLLIAHVFLNVQNNIANLAMWTAN